jgi:hypothetical protein
MSITIIGKGKTDSFTQKDTGVSHTQDLILDLDVDDEVSSINIRDIPSGYDDLVVEYYNFFTVSGTGSGEMIINNQKDLGSYIYVVKELDSTPSIATASITSSFSSAFGANSSTAYRLIQASPGGSDVNLSDSGFLKIRILNYDSFSQTKRIEAEGHYSFGIRFYQGIYMSKNRVNSIQFLSDTVLKSEKSIGRQKIKVYGVRYAV